MLGVKSEKSVLLATRFKRMERRISPLTAGERGCSSKLFHNLKTSKKIKKGPENCTNKHTIQDKAQTTFPFNFELCQHMYYVLIEKEYNVLKSF